MSEWDLTLCRQNNDSSKGEPREDIIAGSEISLPFTRQQRLVDVFRERCVKRG